MSIPNPASETKTSGNLGIRKILVPTDFSSPSKHAFIYAERFAEQFEAELILLNVSETIPPAPRYVPLHEIDEHQEAVHQMLRKQLQEMHQQLTRIPPGTSVPAPRFLVVDGSAADEILRLSSELAVDMIIIATYGRTGLKRWILGSTTERVVRFAPCPVLVVRENEHEFVEIPARG